MNSNIGGVPSRKINVSPYIKTPFADTQPLSCRFLAARRTLGKWNSSGPQVLRYDRRSRRGGPKREGPVGGRPALASVPFRCLTAYIPAGVRIAATSMSPNTSKTGGSRPCSVDQAVRSTIFASGAFFATDAMPLSRAAAVV